VLEGPPDEADLHASAHGLGVVLEMPRRLHPLWAELVPAVDLFSAMQTQWVLDAFGRFALNYAALSEVERRIGLSLSPRRRRQVFADLQVMEAEASKWYRKLRGGPALPAPVGARGRR
jgi:hypothetical protein